MMRPFNPRSITLLRQIVATLVLVWLCSHAQAFEVTGTQKEINLSTQVQYLLDPSKAMSLDQIKQQPNAMWHNTPASAEGGINLGFTTDTIWVRLNLGRTNGSTSEWILELPYVGLDTVNLYLPNGHVLLNGSTVAIDDRPYYSRFFAFPLTLPQQSALYYLEIQSTYPVTLPLRLTERTWHNRAQFIDNLLQFIYYGGLLSLIIYNLVLYAIIKDSKYLLYVLFAFFTGLGIFAGNGYAQLYLWPNSPNWAEIAQTCLFCVAGTFGMVLTRRFLKAGQRLPRASRVLAVLAVCYGLLAICLVVSLWVPIPQQPIYQLVFLVTLIAPMAAFYTSARIAMAGFTSAMYFLMGWAVLCTGVFIAALRIFELIPSNTFTLYAVQISSGIEMLLFSFALAYRFQTERLRREEAQDALLLAQAEIIQAAEKAEERLERAVEARTIKLQKLVLSEQQLREQYVRFGAMIAHEFRNPLNTIASQTSILEMDPEPNTEKLHKRTGIIRSAVSRLVLMFDQWLESDRLATEFSQINVKAIALSAWLQDLVNMCRIYYADHTINLSPCSHDLLIQADDHLLQIALLNLIDNAGKYSPPGSTISIRIEMQQKFIGICVEDSGYGIPIDQQDCVLEPYERSQHDNTAIQGAGLGLAFVNRIIQLHQGKITIDSEPDHGTCITLWLPLGKSD